MRAGWSAAGTGCNTAPPPLAHQINKQIVKANHSSPAGLPAHRATVRARNEGHEHKSKHGTRHKRKPLPATREACDRNNDQSGSSPSWEGRESADEMEQSSTKSKKRAN